MSVKQVRVGDVGTVITLTVYEDGAVKDISSATDLQILIKKPSGELLEKEATFSTDGTDGQLTYTTESDGWTEEGFYEVRAGFSLNFWSGTSTELKVHAEAVE